MGLDLSLIGKQRGLLKKLPASVLEQIAEFAAQSLGASLILGPSLEESGRGPTLWLGLAAMRGGGLSIQARGKRFEVDTRWSLFGPGYCKTACDVLHSIGEEFSLSWQIQADDAECFESRDYSAMVHHAEQWLGHLMSAVTHDKPGPLHGVQLCMPFEPRYDVDVELVTPMGPRDTEWARRGADDASAVRDMLPWWSERMDAVTQRDLALQAMWNDIRFQPAESFDEFEQQIAVARLLMNAHQSDPGLSIPWREWAELLDSIRGCKAGTDHLPQDIDAMMQIAQSHAASASGSLIGYRRLGARFVLPGGWTIALPGSFIEEMEDEETWMAYQAEFIVRASTFSFRISADTQPPPVEQVADQFGIESEPDLAWAADGVKAVGTTEQHEEDGRRFHMLRGFAVADKGGAALVSICFDNPKDRDRAVEVWNTVRPPAADA